MLFENTKRNYIFILSLWAFTFGLDMYLKSIPPFDITNPVAPPPIVMYLPTIVYSIFGVYFGLCLSLMIYNVILGPKLKKSAKNLFAYGIRSGTTLVLIFVDLVSFMAIEHDFGTRVFHSGNALPSWQEFFVLAGFPILGLFLTWNLRNIKLEH